VNLTLTKASAFSQVAQSALTTGTALAAASMQGINENAKFAAVRNEEFFGFCSNGATVPLPVSPADAYEYSRDELNYECSLYWSGGDNQGTWSGNQGAVNNAPNYVLQWQATPPFRGATTGGGQLVGMAYSVNQATGVVSCAMTYMKDGLLATTTTTTDGILFITVIARRLR
jgi:hypothetical protein